MRRKEREGERRREKERWDAEMSLHTVPVSWHHAQNRARIRGGAHIPHTGTQARRSKWLESRPHTPHYSRS